MTLVSTSVVAGILSPWWGRGRVGVRRRQQQDGRQRQQEHLFSTCSLNVCWLTVLSLPLSSPPLPSPYRTNSLLPLSRAEMLRGYFTFPYGEFFLFFLRETSWWHIWTMYAMLYRGLSLKRRSLFVGFFWVLIWVLLISTKLYQRKKWRMKRNSGFTCEQWCAIMDSSSIIAHHCSQVPLCLCSGPRSLEGLIFFFACYVPTR